LIDELIPTYDFVERHSIMISGSPDQAYAALMRADLSSSTLVRTLLFLRGIPGRITRDPDCPRDSPQPRPLTLAGMTTAGFTLLAESPPREIVFGLRGRFWTPSGGVTRTRKEEFFDPLPSELALAIWNFSTSHHPNGSLLSTETRILCGSAAVRKKFRRYWMLIRPFSGLIRLEILRSVRAEAARV
jgi:hypothetical protein